MQKGVTNWGEHTFYIPGEERLFEYAQYCSQSLEITFRKDQLRSLIKREMADVLGDWKSFALMDKNILAQRLGKNHPASKKQLHEILSPERMWDMEQMMQTKIRMYMKGMLSWTGGRSEKGFSHDEGAVRSAFTTESEVHDLLPIDATAQRVSGVKTTSDPRSVTRRKRKKQE